MGDKWSYLQRSKFGANAQPFYVLLDNEGKPLNKSYSYDEDVNKYIDFLQTGLKNYKEQVVLVWRISGDVSDANGTSLFLWLVFNVIFHRNEQGFGRFAV